MNFKMTKERADQLGLIICANCPHRESNHFEGGKRVCAHCSCIGFKLKGIQGVTVFKQKKVSKIDLTVHKAHLRTVVMQAFAAIS